MSDSGLKNDEVGSLTLRRLILGETYAGLSEGHATRELNKRIIKSMAERIIQECAVAPVLIGKDANTYEMEEIVKSEGSRKLLFTSQEEWFERICCLGELESSWNDDPDADSYSRGSTLWVIWFQDDWPWPFPYEGAIRRLDVSFGTPPSSIAFARQFVEALEKLEWKDKAIKFSWDP